jgi:hypothetical protein
MGPAFESALFHERVSPTGMAERPWVRLVDFKPVFVRLPALGHFQDFCELCMGVWWRELQ